MEKITRKGEVKSIVDDCLSTYQNGNVTDLAENLARTILSAKVKFPLLEFAAIKLHDAVSEEEQITFCKVIARLGAEGGNVLIGIILQKRLESHFEESIEVATSIMKSGQEWFITDIIGERVIGWALLNFPEKAIPRIKEIRNRESQWVVRSIGSGSHHAIKKGLEKRFVSEVFEVLLSLANSREHQVKTGIGWAAKTAAKFHPEIVKQYESRIQDPEKVGQWFRTKVRIGFERNAYPREIESKTILNKTKRRDPWFLDDYTINPYSACSFNCLYCYIRGSKYGEHMEKSLAVKTNAPELLRKQLATRAKKNQYGIIVLASATDPYLKIEKETELTRQLLEIILEFRFPVHIITKSELVTRDLDLLLKINQQAILPFELKDKLRGGTIVTFSFSTLKNDVSKIFERGATPPSKRVRALEEVKSSGLTTGVSLMPLLPYISDTGEQLEEYFSTFKAIGVDYVLPATLTLFGDGKADSKTLMLKAVKKHFPEVYQKYEKFFAKGNGVPKNYREAFRKKIRELHEEFGVSNSILRI